MDLAKPGARVDNGTLIPQIDFTGKPMRVSTERYYSPDFHKRERENLWMRTWQIAGREEDIPEAGDWIEYKLFDQSWVLARGRDGAVRGFVNACRHRGNAFCEGKGHSARFTCPYHNWSYGLDGQLLAVAKPDFEGTVEDFVGDKSELGLIEAPVECFAGFIFLNPDPKAAPLADFLGEARDMIAPYRLDEMVTTGMNVRENIVCNWKVVMDAFEEAYHVQGTHPELVAGLNLLKERCSFFGDHAVTTVPFGPAGKGGIDAEGEADIIANLPAPNFPALAEALPRFRELIAGYRNAGGKLELPAGMTANNVLQQAVREKMTEDGCDVSGLTDVQMSDYQFWLLFPNVYMQLRAGEATVIIAAPHGGGDPNRCFWRVYNLQWFPPEQRAAMREPLLEIPDGEHFPYFLALQQDYEQMEVQQRGLRNTALKFMSLTRQEPKVAHFHAAVDAWVGG